MFALFRPLKSALALLARAEPQHDRDEAYLADAVDIYDLERRMRAIDNRARNANAGITFGLYPC